MNPYREGFEFETQSKVRIKLYEGRNYWAQLYKPTESLPLEEVDEASPWTRNATEAGGTASEEIAGWNAILRHVNIWADSATMLEDGKGMGSYKYCDKGSPRYYHRDVSTKF